ncbi:MAG: hypothetical protein ACLQVD_05410 [Capsulimonadaceae bacterium]
MNLYARSKRFRSWLCHLACSAVCATLLLAGGAAYAAGNVYNWTDVPQDQRVPVDHATFDAGGYQIYDTVGETIIVPFRNHNLYVMKFAVSHDGTTFFINRGYAPVMYLPWHGYLENATVPGARWYPFSPRFHPAAPVFIGIAPSWNVYVNMGWYPHMYYWGGYWGHAGLGVGAFVAMAGLFFLIDGHHYYGWNPYHNYYANHWGWHHPGFYRRDYYHWAANPPPYRRPFGGFGHPAHMGFGGGPHFYPRHPGGFGNGGFHGIQGMHAHGGPGFHGGGFANHSFGGGRPFGGGGHAFGGGGWSHNGGEHSFGGGGWSHGGGEHSFGGGGGHSFGGGGGHSSDRDHRR